MAILKKTVVTRRKSLQGSCKHHIIITIRRIFIEKEPSNKYNSNTFIVDDGDLLHMVTTVGNMANLKNSKTRVTVEYSVKFTGIKHDNRKGYQKHDDKLHRVVLSNSAVIPGVHKNIFSVTRALQKGFQIMS